MNLNDLAPVLDRLETLRDERDEPAFMSASRVIRTGVITEGDAANIVELLIRLAERAAAEAINSALPSEDLRGYAIDAIKLAGYIGTSVLGNRLAPAR